MKPKLSHSLGGLCVAWMFASTALTGWAACGAASLNGFTNLPTDGGFAFQVYGLNTNGQLTGYFSGPGVPNPHAFLYTAGAVTDLGTLGGPVSEGLAINSSGQVAGDSYLADFQFHAFLTQSNLPMDLGTLGGDYSSPNALNDSGQVVGASYMLGDAALNAFLFSSNGIVNLGTLGGGYSVAFAINGPGLVAGESTLANGDTHAFLYLYGVMADLGTLGSNYSSARAINDSGTVVGQSTLANGQTHAFLFASRVMTDMGTLGGSSSTVVAINRAGQITGAAATLNDAENHGFFFSGGVMTDIGTLGGNYSTPSALNNLGQVVGDSALSNGVAHAFLWRLGLMTDLNALLPTNSGWELTSAKFVNDSGRIVGSGLYQGVSEWFIMDVVPANQSPVAVAGPDQLVECGKAVVLDGTGSSDPDGDTLTYQWSTQGNVLGTTPTLSISLPLGTNVVTLTVADPCGASSQTNVTVVVRDTTPPTGSCPGAFTASADANGLAPIPNVLPQVVASDNCTASNSLALAQDLAAGTLVGPGPHPITVTVTDASGNSSTCGVLFTVIDTTPPVIASVPAPATVSADVNCQGAVPNVLTGVVATDNCTPTNQLVMTQNPAAGTVLGTGQYTITIKVADAAGNTATGTVALKVADTTAPTILSTQAPANVSADANCQGAVPNVLTGVVATDNCTSSNRLVITQDPPAGTVVGTGQYTVTVKVTDAAGNSSTASVPFKVVDTTAPLILSTPAPITLSADANCLAVVPNVLPGVVATDNCTPTNQLVMTQNPAPGTVVGTGQYTITVKVTDGAGNSSTATVPFKVADTTAPVIVSTPAPITVSADSNCLAVIPNVLPGVVATDNCTPTNQLVMTQNPLAGTVVGTGQYTITINVADAAGNTSTATVPFQVVDTTAPVFVSVPGPLTVPVDTNCQGAVPNVLPSVMAVDNCTPAAKLSLTQNPAAGAVLGIGQYVITVTVTDVAGNSSSAGVSLAIVGQPPVVQSITASPNNLNPPNSKLVPVTLSVVTSATCGPAPACKLVSITCNYPTSPGDMQITGDLTALLAANKGPSGYERDYTLAVQCTDASGNTSTATVTVSVPHNNDANNGVSPNSTKKD